MAMVARSRSWGSRLSPVPKGRWTVDESASAVRERVSSVTSLSFSVTPVERMDPSNDAAVSLRRVSVRESRWVVDESDASVAKSDRALTPSECSLSLRRGARAQSVDARRPRRSSRAKGYGYEPPVDGHVTTRVSAVTTGEFSRPESAFRWVRDTFRSGRDARTNEPAQVRGFR
jgi:hypothetical protein